jgi:hypothetical protein
MGRGGRGITMGKPFILRKPTELMGPETRPNPSF